MVQYNSTYILKITVFGIYAHIFSLLFLQVSDRRSKRDVEEGEWQAVPSGIIYSATPQKIPLGSGLQVEMSLEDSNDGAAAGEEKTDEQTKDERYSRRYERSSSKTEQEGTTADKSYVRQHFLYSKPVRTSAGSIIDRAGGSVTETAYGHSVFKPLGSNYNAQHPVSYTGNRGNVYAHPSQLSNKQNSNSAFDYHNSFGTQVTRGRPFVMKENIDSTDDINSAISGVIHKKQKKSNPVPVKKVNLADYLEGTSSSDTGKESYYAALLAQSKENAQKLAYNDQDGTDSEKSSRQALLRKLRQAHLDSEFFNAVQKASGIPASHTLSSSNDLSVIVGKPTLLDSTTFRKGSSFDDGASLLGSLGSSEEIIELVAKTPQVLVQKPKTSTQFSFARPSSYSAPSDISLSQGVVPHGLPVHGYASPPFAAPPPLSYTITRIPYRPIYGGYKGFPKKQIYRGYPSISPYRGHSPNYQYGGYPSVGYGGYPSEGYGRFPVKGYGGNKGKGHGGYYGHGYRGYHGKGYGGHQTKGYGGYYGGVPPKGHGKGYGGYRGKGYGGYPAKGHGYGGYAPSYGGGYGHGPGGFATVYGDDAGGYGGYAPGYDEYDAPPYHADEPPQKDMKEEIKDKASMFDFFYDIKDKLEVFGHDVKDKFDYMFSKSEDKDKESSEYGPEYGPGYGPEYGPSAYHAGGGAGGIPPGDLHAINVAVQSTIHGGGGYRGGPGGGIFEYGIGDHGPVHGVGTGIGHHSIIHGGGGGGGVFEYGIDEYGAGHGIGGHGIGHDIIDHGVGLGVHGAGHGGGVFEYGVGDSDIGHEVGHGVVGLGVGHGAGLNVGHGIGAHGAGVGVSTVYHPPHEYVGGTSSPFFVKNVDSETGLEVISKSPTPNFNVAPSSFSFKQSRPVRFAYSVGSDGGSVKTPVYTPIGGKSTGGGLYKRETSGHAKSKNREDAESIAESLFPNTDFIFQDELEALSEKYTGDEGREFQLEFLLDNSEALRYNEADSVYDPRVDGEEKEVKYFIVKDKEDGDSSNSKNKVFAVVS